MFCNTLVKKILKLSPEFMCTATGAFIEDSSPQKNAGKQLSMKFFAALSLLQTPGEKIQRGER
jgi:hypothetical protein